MPSDSICAGDLAIVDPMIDRSTLHLHLQLQLRDSSDDRFYSSAITTLLPGEMLLILDIKEKDAMVVASNGAKGWISKDSLRVLSRYI